MYTNNESAEYIFEEGDPCMNDLYGGKCNGIMIFGKVVNCSCHTGHAPCRSCTSVELECNVCGWSPSYDE